MSLGAPILLRTGRAQKHVPSRSEKIFIPQQPQAPVSFDQALPSVEKERHCPGLGYPDASSRFTFLPGTARLRFCDAVPGHVDVAMYCRPLSNRRHQGQGMVH
jgi:hypothetical protein